MHQGLLAAAQKSTFETQFLILVPPVHQTVTRVQQTH